MITKHDSDLIILAQPGFDASAMNSRRMRNTFRRRPFLVLAKPAKAGTRSPQRVANDGGGVFNIGLTGRSTLTRKWHLISANICVICGECSHG